MPRVQWSPCPAVFPHVLDLLIHDRAFVASVAAKANPCNRLYRLTSADFSALVAHQFNHHLALLCALTVIFSRAPAIAQCSQRYRVVGRAVLRVSCSHPVVEGHGITTCRFTGTPLIGHPGILSSRLLSLVLSISLSCFRAVSPAPTFAPQPVARVGPAQKAAQAPQLCVRRRRVNVVCQRLWL